MRFDASHGCLAFKVDDEFIWGKQTIPENHAFAHIGYLALVESGVRD